MSGVSKGRGDLSSRAANELIEEELREEVSGSREGFEDDYLFEWLNKEKIHFCVRCAFWMPLLTIMLARVLANPLGGSIFQRVFWTSFFFDPRCFKKSRGSFFSSFVSSLSKLQGFSAPFAIFTPALISLLTVVAPEEYNRSEVVLILLIGVEGQI